MWLRPVSIGLSLLLGILLGNWALTQWLSSQIKGQLRESTPLEARIAEQHQTLGRRPGGRPAVHGERRLRGAAARVKAGWELDEPPAILLSSE